MDAEQKERLLYLCILGLAQEIPEASPKWLAAVGKIIKEEIDGTY